MSAPPNGSSLVSVGYVDPGNWATDLEGGARPSPAYATAEFPLPAGDSLRCNLKPGKRIRTVGRRHIEAARL
jgi:hypothetical protein